MWWMSKNKVLSTYACWGDYKNKKLWFFLLESSKKNYFCSGQGKDKVKRPPSISSLSKNDSSQSPHCPKLTPLSLLTVQKWPPAISSLSENDPPQSQSWKKWQKVEKHWKKWKSWKMLKKLKNIEKLFKKWGKSEKK